MSKKKSSNGAYDDVKQLQLRAKDMLAKFGRQAVEARKAHFDDPAMGTRAKEVADGVEKDVREFNTQINSIGKKHSAWAEKPKSGRDYQRALGVGCEYVDVISNIQLTLGDPAAELVELMNNQNIQAEAALAQP